MKKYGFIMAMALTTTVLASPFENLIAFGRAPEKQPMYKKQEEKRERAKFFFGYKLFLNQPGDNEPADNYANLTDPNGNVSLENSNYDWELGHFGVIGVQLPNTMFKVFFEGWFFDNKKTRTILAGNDSIGVGTAFINPTLGLTPTQVKPRSKNELYIVNFFVSYAAYRKGNFFFIPYAGARYIKGKHDLKAAFSDGINTTTLIHNYDREAFGVVMALTIKYFFTPKFYAFGDYRYAILFGRSTIFDSNQSTLQQGFIPGTQTTIRNDTDEMFELAFGAGYFIVDRKCWSLVIDACYQMTRWEDANQNHQSLGLGVTLGF